VNELEARTLIHLPPEDVYEFLLDFPNYANYSEYLERVHGQGNGGPGTRYYLKFAWWKLNYTAHSEVTAVEKPSRIDWELTDDLDAEGYWQVESAPDAAEAVEVSSKVTLHISYDPSSVTVSNMDFPSFVSIGWLLDKVKPKIAEEAERVVERIVEDLEGEPRPVDLEVQTSAGAL
jgi:uncharacterized membrane protein